MGGPHNSDSLNCLGPHVSGVVLPSLLSLEAEGLAWESSSDCINHSLIACGVPVTDECSDIGEDRRSVNEAVFLALSDKFLAVFFDLDIS